MSRRAAVLAIESGIDPAIESAIESAIKTGIASWRPRRRAPAKLRALRFIVAPAVALLSLLIIGCTPSPERLCARKMRLSEDQWGKMAPEVHRLGLKNCIEDARQRQRDDKKRYACHADCVMSSKGLYDGADCERQCN
ncbi:MAG: hypothetical protein NVSMB1_22450 [Polyangiales bacterium]